MSIKLKEPKLTIELIPSTCFRSNVRTMVSTKDWDKIRHISYESANNKCEICGDTGKNQGYKHNVECHEIWDYDDDNHIQKLVGLISLCVNCHQVKHIGRAIAIGKQTQCFSQLSKINKWTEKQITKHITESFDLHKKRSKHQWGLDISLLTQDPYNIVLKPTKERIFETKKYKKKPKNKTVGVKKVHPKSRLSAVLKPKKSTKKRPNKFT